jgi:type IV pilus assembly protein PilO
MISALNKKERLLLIGITISCLITLFLFYFFVYFPQKDRLRVNYEELKTEQKILAAIEKKTSQIENHTYRDTKSLQGQIPIDPLIEQLILQFEKVEVLSQSTIQSMSFTKEDFLFSSEENEDSSLEDGGEPSAEEVLDKDTSSVKRLQITMTVESENYFAMEKFISELENLERIVEINQLVFEGREEMSPGLDGGQPQPLSYQLVVSAFYLPELTDLQDSVPTIDSPPPSMKKDPFIQYTDPSITTNDNDAEN